MTRAATGEPPSGDLPPGEGTGAAGERGSSEADASSCGAAGPLVLQGLLSLLALFAPVRPQVTWPALALYALGSLLLAARRDLEGGPPGRQLPDGGWRRALLLEDPSRAGLCTIALARFASTRGPQRAGAPCGWLPLTAPLTALALRVLVLVKERLWRGQLAAALPRAGRRDWQMVLPTRRGDAADPGPRHLNGLPERSG